MGKNISENKDEFLDFVIRAVENITERPIPDGSLLLNSVCESISDVIEIVQDVENKLHITINDMCLDQNLDLMTIESFSEILRNNIV